MADSVLVTGSNRGIGLEFVRQFAQEGWRVYATCRQPAEAEDLKRVARSRPKVSIHRLDVTSREEIKAMIWELEGSPLDILINNAGIYLESGRYSCAGGTGGGSS